MNTPNKLTLARMIATPVFMATMLIDFDYHYLVSMVIFIAASLTDMIDGKMARKYNLVTDFGKFADPLADKMLVNLAFLALVVLGVVPVWVFAIILVRDFAVDGMRMMAARDGVTIAASFYGKLKTTTQMTALIILLLNLIVNLEFFTIIGNIALYLALILTVFSGGDYLIKGWKKVIK